MIIEDESVMKSVKYFLTGFQGLGSVGYIAIKHIIDEKKAKRVGVILSKAAPPFVYLENEKLVMPFELYVFEEILMFLPRLPPYRHTEAEFTELLLNWVLSQNKIEKIILIGGVDKTLQTPDDSNIKFVPTRKFITSNTKISDLKKNMLSSGLMIQGPLAIMLGMLDLKNFPAVGILSFADREHPDPKGAASAIGEACNLLNFECSVAELISNDELFDDEIKNLPQSKEEYSGGPPETYT